MCSNWKSVFEDKSRLREEKKLKRAARDNCDLGVSSQDPTRTTTV